MSKKGISLDLVGFDVFVKKLEAAGQSVDATCEKAIKRAADTADSALREEMKRSNVSSRLISSMPPPEIEKKESVYTARVGYKKGAYHPENPSDGYKVVFLNYGTPRRKKHGKVKARGFISRAKRKAKARIKQAENDAFETIIKEVK